MLKTVLITIFFFLVGCSAVNFYDFADDVRKQKEYNQSIYNEMAEIRQRKEDDVNSAIIEDTEL